MNRTQRFDFPTWIITIVAYTCEMKRKTRWTDAHINMHMFINSLCLFFPSMSFFLALSQRSNFIAFIHVLFTFLSRLLLLLCMKLVDRTTSHFTHVSFVLLVCYFFLLFLSFITRSYRTSNTDYMCICKSIWYMKRERERERNRYRYVFCQWLHTFLHVSQARKSTCLGPTIATMDSKEEHTEYENTNA
jgi:hypothetical protein